MTIKIVECKGKPREMGRRYGEAARNEIRRDLEDIKKLLCSHEPWEPCRHGGVHVSKTEWSMINFCYSGKYLISSGAPCENQYIEYSI